MARKSELERFMDRVANHTAHLCLIWPLLILCFVLLFYFFQRAESGDLNLIAVALTTFEIFIVVALAGGFWTVRSAAIERAEEAARKVAQECTEAEVKAYVELFVAPKLIRQIIEQSEDLGGGVKLTEQTVDDIIDALDYKEG